MARVRDRQGIRPHGTLRENAQRLSVLRVADMYGFVPYIHDPAQVTELHNMRIAAKHLRYTLEIFSVCFGPEIDDRIEDVKSVQEQIGQIHDCDVLIELLRRHLSVLAQREQERLAALATASLAHEERMATIRAAIDAYVAQDPRIGILALLSRKTDERQRRYAEFIQWWDEQERGELRARIYACITAGSNPHEQAAEGRA